MFTSTVGRLGDSDNAALKYGSTRVGLGKITALRVLVRTYIRTLYSCSDVILYQFFCKYPCHGGGGG